MIIREFEVLDTSNRKRVFAECKCSICNSIYIKQKRLLNKWNTCSLLCTKVSKGETIICNCDHCNESFFRAKSKTITKSGKLFCSRSCKEAAQKYMVEIQPEHYGKGSGIYSYRDIAFTTYGKVCNRCNYSINEAALVVHHKDHDRNNNNISNLEVLCANCHAIHHWG